jgi:hypothetical protein
MQFLCQPNNLIDHSCNKLINIIPKEIDPLKKIHPTDFSRDRNLNYPKIITYTLSLTTGSSTHGMDIHSGQFFNNAQRIGIWIDSEPSDKSCISRAREKVPYTEFVDIFSHAVRLAYELWPEREEYSWHGMSVFACDGSKFILPATDEIRAFFDPDSGLEKPGKGHFPQGLVTTIYDVFRRIPIARTMVDAKGSEREELIKLISYIPSGQVSMYDRGYPSYEVINEHLNKYSGFFLFRCPSAGTFPAVENFVKSGKNEGVIWITPSNKYKEKLGIQERLSLKCLKVRILRLESPDGTVSVLLTNLFGKNRFKYEEITTLYFRRWRIEEYDRDEKVTMGIEKFHSRKKNGILQELYSACIMSVITRMLMMLCKEYLLPKHQDVQFKNALLKLSMDACVLVSDDPVQTIKIFNEILNEISRVKYYKPKNPRPPQPRVNKSPLNKWKQGKTKKCAANA